MSANKKLSSQPNLKKPSKAKTPAAAKKIKESDKQKHLTGQENLSHDSQPQNPARNEGIPGEATRNPQDPRFS